MTSRDSVFLQGVSAMLARSIPTSLPLTQPPHPNTPAENRRCENWVAMKVTLELRDSAELQVIVKALRNEADRKRAYRPDGTDEILDRAVAQLARKG
jgi:hypothetical protein